MSLSSNVNSAPVWAKEGEPSPGAPPGPAIKRDESAMGISVRWIFGRMAVAIAIAIAITITISRRTVWL
jgi:hypothetical protein